MLAVAVLTAPAAASAAQPGATSEPGVQQDAATGTTTITGGGLTMTLATKGEAAITSLRQNGSELLSAGLFSSAQLHVDGSTLDSRHLAADPKVSARGTQVDVAFTLSNGALSIDETWHVVARADGIDVSSQRTYDWKESTDTAITHNGQLDVGWARVFDDIRRPEDGGNLPIGNAYTGANGFYLSKPNDRYGVEEGTFVMLANSRSEALAVTASSDRHLATEFAYTGDGNTYQETQVSADPTWTYTAGTPASGLVYGGHSSNATSALIYSPVSIPQGQQDSVSFHFASTDAAAYTGLNATINGVADTRALSSLLNEFGRSGIIDKGYGMSTVGLEYPGVGPYDMVYADRTVLGLYDPATTASQQNLLTYFKDNAQQSTGHMKGRSFHRDTTWTANQLFDADPAYALSVSDMYQYGGDRTWLDAMRGSVESALGYMMTSQYVAGDGLFRNDTVSCTKLAGLREWNDAYYVKYESAYINELMYGALTAWGALERDVYHDAEKAASYLDTAAAIKARFNRSTTDGGLWDDKTGMFAYWRCPDGTTQGATEHTQINLQAITYGLVDLPRAQQILHGIDKAVAQNHLALIPQNFIPMKANVEDWTGDHFQTGLEDGAVYPFMTEEYMRAAALVGERDTSLAYLDNTLARYTKDGFNGFSFVDWQLRPHTGEAWFPSNANGAAGLFSDVLGIQPTASGVTIAPNIPAKMNGTSVTRTIHANDTLTVRYNSELSQTVMYRGAGDVTLQWSGQEPGRTYTVRDEDHAVSATADAFGIVRYTYTPHGVRTIALSDGSTSGYVVPDDVPTDLALHAVVTSSSSLEDGSYSAATVTDGDLFSADRTWGWSSSSDTGENHSEWVTVDLGKAQQVGSVELDQRDYDLKDVGTGFPVDFTVETSVDGVTWSPGVAQTGYAKPASYQGQSFSFDARSARYVRVTGTNLRPDSGQYRMQFAEIQVFGQQ
ncbi:hypothetical protein GCM10023087_07670 [Microbacterium rhizosphaerae]